MYVKLLVSVPEPEDVVTATFFVPAVPAGVTAVIRVAETTLKLVAACPPIVTAVAPVKAVPVMVIVVPPTVEPVGGVTAVTFGATGAEAVQVALNVRVL
ncbi:hypothetical protein BJF91_10780 [Allorhizobium taibaishanense]|uniref:Uncharacterized protein n=1 Tax=Allorhizobium taibaishanense TaxID=887144 RepID=A0A1Q8ZYU3_9HYPH|nr:hypothetical protein BJF91_10780 [Allorhizobium taibaishanense]